MLLDYLPASFVLGVPSLTLVLEFSFFGGEVLLLEALDEPPLDEELEFELFPMVAHSLQRPRAIRICETLIECAPIL
jgi:hypothetical protein